MEHVHNFLLVLFKVRNLSLVLKEMFCSCFCMHLTHLFEENPSIMFLPSRPVQHWTFMVFILNNVLSPIYYYIIWNEMKSITYSRYSRPTNLFNFVSHNTYFYWLDYNKMYAAELAWNYFENSIQRFLYILKNN